MIARIPGNVKNASRISSEDIFPRARGARTAIVRKTSPNWSARSSRNTMALLKPADSIKSNTADAPVISELPDARPRTKTIKRGRLPLTSYRLLSRIMKHTRVTGFVST
jgi:hypothetical protein